MATVTDEKIAGLWKLLAAFREKAAAIAKAPMFNKIKLAEEFTEHEGDLLKAIISVNAYQAARIDKLEEAVREINSGESTHEN